MKTRKKKASLELLALRNSLRGEVVYENGIQVLKMDEDMGQGSVRCVCFDEGLVAMEFDILLNQDVMVSLDWTPKNMIYFFYCLKGNCFHRFKEGEVYRKLEELQTAVALAAPGKHNLLLVRKGERLVLNFIRVDKERYVEKFRGDKEGFDAKTLELLDSFEKKRGYFHLGKYNLEIAELIKLLENAKYVNDISTLMQFEGICHLILAKQIEQFRFELEYGNGVPTTLLRRELKLIGEVCDYVKYYPGEQHSIGSLCSKVGLTASKLQQGVKFIHGMTAGEYIREVRLQKAEELIRSTDMNISEVVYSVGLTSRSYFCKIFKKRFQCSPKVYKDKTYKKNPGIKKYQLTMA